MILEMGGVSADKVCFFVSHHNSAPIIALPKNPSVDYKLTLRLDAGQTPSFEHLANRFITISPPVAVTAPSIAFSDSLIFFQVDSATENYDTVGVFQYRRILGVNSTSSHPVRHRYAVQSARLLKGIEDTVLNQKQDVVFVANPISVTSIEEQYSIGHPSTLHLLIHLREVFREKLLEFGLDPGSINPTLLFWSSLYLGPRKPLLEFQKLLLETFGHFDYRAVPRKLSAYESRWIGFVVERLFSDYIQCLASNNPGLVQTRPVLMLNELPLSYLFARKPSKGLSFLG